MQLRISALRTLLFLANCLFLLNCSSRTAETQQQYNIVTIVDTPIAPPVMCRDTALSCFIDSIWVSKHSREMYVFNSGRLLKVYHISLGTTPVGAKHFEGDRKTPEGLYYIQDRNPNSMAHKNLGVSYPNDADRSYARRHRRPTGGSIKIHGMVNGYEKEEEAYKNTDWTWGCIAVLNKDIDELYEHVVIGSPIWITP